MFGVKQNCKVGEWGSWSPCSAKCGSQATHTRERPKTVPEKNGGSCLMPLTETQTCTGLPACEVPPLTGQYEPCQYERSTLDAGMCRIHGRNPTASECEDLKNQAAAQGAAYGAAGGGLGAAIGAGIAAGEVDCGEVYSCPTGFRDTKVNQMCEMDAIPKCPPDYEWNNDRKLCKFKNP